MKTIFSIILFIIFQKVGAQMIRTDSIMNFPSFPICYESNGEKIVSVPNFSGKLKSTECTYFWVDSNDFRRMESRSYNSNGAIRAIGFYELILADGIIYWSPKDIWREFDEDGVIVSEENWINGVSIEIIYFRD